MKKIALSLALMLLAGPAFATGSTCIGGSGCNTNITSNNAGGAGGSSNQTQSQANTQTNTQTNQQVNSQTTNVENNNRDNNANLNDQDVSVSIYEEDKREVHSAYAPALSAGSDTCLGSTSAGAQGGIFGLSFGTNWTDQNCENIRSAKALFDMGEKQAALLIMCLANGGRNVVALEASGHDCSPVTDGGKETASVPLGMSGPVQVATVTETKALVIVTRSER